MKQVIIAVVVIALVVLAIANVEKIEQLFHPGETKVAGMWVDREGVDKISKQITGGKGHEAFLKGDTYCRNCDKFIEGRVRICTYCGQYI